jgi:hypothetical protein
MGRVRVRVRVSGKGLLLWRSAERLVCVPLTSHRRSVPSPEAEANKVADVGDQIVEYTQ